MFFRLLKEGFIFAVNSIFVNKLRTFLSLFGITIGIFSIISVFTVLDWMENSIRDSISSMGDNVLYVHKFPWGLNMDVDWFDIMKRPVVTKDDYLAVLERSSKASAACFSVSQGENIKYIKNIANGVYVSAVSPEYVNIRSFEIENGRYFTPEESASGKNVAILGAVIAEKLFDKANPVGKQVTIAGKKTSVIGVFTKEGKGGIGDNGMDEQTVIPLNFGKTFMNMKNTFLDATLMIKAKEGVPIQELSDEATMILRAARRLRPEVKENFSINRASIISDSFSGVFAGINVGGWVIGGFAILVGGFGIANIMFV
jgi:putative ABC transport system permease protein